MSLKNLDITNSETQYYGDERNLPSLPMHRYVPPSLEEQEAERQKDQLQIDFLRRSKHCDMTLPAVYRKTETMIFYMDM